MLKIRITYADEQELKEALQQIHADFNVLSESDPYKGRGKSQYNNIYLDVDLKKK